MKKMQKMNEIVDTTLKNVEIVIGLKGTNTIMFVDKKLKPIAEKIFTSIDKEFDIYLAKDGNSIPLFIIKTEDFIKVLKIFDKMKEDI